MSQVATNTAPNHVAGTISQSSGPVTVERHGIEVELRIGDPIYASDTIKTGVHSVELSFIDGAKATLGPGSVMSVQEFSYNASNEAESSFVLNLAEGALRAVSGQVVAQNPDAFKIITPKATAGIRGTDFIIQLGTDGSERFALISIDLGHTLVVTSHAGGQVSLSFSNEGAEIPAGESTPIPIQFTPDEIEDIVQAVIAALADIGTPTEGSDQTALLLEGLTAQALVQATLSALESTYGEESLSGGLNEQEEENLIKSTDVFLDSIANDTTESAPSLVTISTTGNINFAADGQILNDGASHILASQHIIITQAMATPETTISGDVFDIANGTSVVAGSDSITGSAMQEGQIVGDAISLSSATDSLTAGNDTITLTSMSGDATLVFGDTHLADFGQVSFGHDSITITGNLSGGKIYGDAQSVSITPSNWGNDTIIINGTMSNSSIHGDSNLSDQGGHDSIFVSTMTAGAGIYGNGGNDEITVNVLTSSGTIDGGAGNDTIKITSVYGDSGGSISSIKLGSGEDILTIGSLGPNVMIDAHGSATITANVTNTSSAIIPNPTNLTMPSIDCSNAELDIYLNISGTGAYYVQLVGFDAASADTLFIDNANVTSSVGASSSETFNIDGGTLTVYFS